MNGNEPVTKSDLLAFESRFDGKLSGLGSRFDGKLSALESRFDGKLSALESRFDGKLDVLEQRLLDRMGQMIRDSETRLLQAFYSFAETNNKRLAQFEATDVLLLTRVTTLESRVLEVEKRLNIPPAA
jgi:hypothetical protein